MTVWVDQVYNIALIDRNETASMESQEPYAKHHPALWMDSIGFEKEKP